MSLDLDWQAEALCKGIDPELFYPPRRVNEDQAKRVCGRCPVQSECLQFARDNGEVHGIWGGKNRGERVKLGARRSVVKRVPCGSTAGYAQHRRLGEDSCRSCREANAVAGRIWRENSLDRG